MSKSAWQVLDEVLTAADKYGDNVHEIIEGLGSKGYVILPKEPSEKMIEAAYALDPMNIMWPDSPDAIYRAMLKTYEESGE